ncbi:hypothetical protein [Microbacterium sp. PA5]|uniref:hypothetical protein n=1 Tax=Microbacterium sp. PA5 TaxID=3416654 RepID=UPI003CE75B4A
MNADDPASHPDSIQGPDPGVIAELATYMARNSVNRLEVRLEDLPEAFAWRERTTVVERASLTDDSVPSDLGIDGVFYITRVC